MLTSTTFPPVHPIKATGGTATTTATANAAAASGGGSKIFSFLSSMDQELFRSFSDMPVPARDVDVVTTLAASMSGFPAQSLTSDTAFASSLFRAGYDDDDDFVRHHCDTGSDTLSPLRDMSGATPHHIAMGGAPPGSAGMLPQHLTALPAALKSATPTSDPNTEGGNFSGRETPLSEINRLEPLSCDTDVTPSARRRPPLNLPQSATTPMPVATKATAAGAAAAKKTRRMPITPTQLASILRMHSMAQGGGPCDVACPAGFEVTVYDNDFSNHFVLPSEKVNITKGVMKYVEHHSRYGTQTRFRFQLCGKFRHQKCNMYSECTYIHATELRRGTMVHLNPFAPRRLAADRHGRSCDVPLSVQDDPAAANSYPTMPGGYVVNVYPPMGNQISSAVTMVPSNMLIRTAGAEKAFAAYAQAGGDFMQVTISPRHCTKFQYRRACPLGPACTEIHSKIPFAGTALDAVPQRCPSNNAGGALSASASDALGPGEAVTVEGMLHAATTELLQRQQQLQHHRHTDPHAQPMTPLPEDPSPVSATITPTQPEARTTKVPTPPAPVGMLACPAAVGGPGVMQHQPPSIAHPPVVAGAGLQAFTSLIRELVGTYPPQGMPPSAAMPTFAHAHLPPPPSYSATVTPSRTAAPQQQHVVYVYAQQAPPPPPYAAYSNVHPGSYGW
jgi:hypothetical protein